MDYLRSIASPEYTLFFLSPAHLGKERAQLLYREGASFALAQRLRSAEGAPLGEVFAVVSGRYCRGTLADATAVGKALAESAKKAGIETCVFDRAGYLFHGRVKALAEGAREGGLQF